MSLLSDKELRALVPNSDNLESARAIEAAILAKLAAKELPEPAISDGEWFEENSRAATDFYTAAQLHEAHAQGFAAGASAQLSAEPFTHYRHYDEQVQPFADGNTVPLYTRREAK